MRCLVACVALFQLSSSAALAVDWPQWLGPQRDSVWREEGIVNEFPSEGLRDRWRVPVGLGYSGPAVAAGKVYVLDYQRESGEIVNSPGGRGQLQGKERVLCFDAQTGNPIWEHAYECPYDVSYPGGPRCTPTVDEGRVYALGAQGDFWCLDARDGAALWRKDFVEEYGAPVPMWGFAAHPLVNGDLVYCLVGGEGSIAVAFDKRTGEEVWRALSADEQGYCPPTMIELEGVKQLLIWHPRAISGLDAATGEVLWSQEFQPAYGMSVTAPRQHGNHLYVSGIGHVGALFELKARQSGVEVLWRGTTKSAIYGCNSTPVIVNGVMYGADCAVGSLMAARLADGERLWETFEPTTGGDRRASHGTAFLVRHEDRFFLFSETGDLILAKLSPEGYEELSRAHILEPTNECFGRDVVWSHPAFADKCVFARNDKQLVCVSLAEGD